MRKIPWREVFKFLSGVAFAGSIANFYTFTTFRCRFSATRSHLACLACVQRFNSSYSWCCSFSGT
jgi:hypothetical protein